MQRYLEPTDVRNLRTKSSLRLSFLLVFLWAPLTVPVPACLNVNATTVDGYRSTGMDTSHVYSLRRAMHTQPKSLTARDKFGDSDTELGQAESLAIDNIYAGEVATAVEMLISLETKHPGNYTTAANLGTAYELLGDVENALKWIQTGYERNPESHHGTEWLHVLILEAKVAAKKAPGSTPQARLLEFPERVTAASVFVFHGKPYAMRDVSHALEHQLEERMVFVKPKDWYVAEMLYSYAMIKANVSSLESAVSLLSLAEEYGFADAAKLQEGKEYFEKLLMIARFKRWTPGVLVAMFLIWFLSYCMRKKWIFASRAAYEAHRSAQRLKRG